MAKAIPMAVVLKNTSEKPWEGYYDGRYYIVEPGATQTFDEPVAKYFVGDWDIDDEELRIKEKQRVYCMMGVDQHRLYEEHKPQMEIDKQYVPPGQQVAKKDKRTEPAPIIAQDTEPEFAKKPTKKKAK
jgi:hypothetical protein